MAAAAGSQHRRVFVGNIPYDTTEEQLIQICEEVGPVVSFRLVIDRETGKPKGYGFCEYKDEETALSARRNLNGYDINGRQLRVDFAENDKGLDRSKEQGRGGPGLPSTADAYKALPGPPLLADSTLHQPIGLALASTAASSMARILGGSQSTSSFQNGSQNIVGSGNDPLTQYLAKMSRQQLNGILSEIKVLAGRNKPLAQQLLQGIPQLPKALFQAQIMLGMVTPNMMQMTSTRQPSSSVQNPVQPQSQQPSPLQPQVHAQGLYGKSGFPVRPHLINQPQVSSFPNSNVLTSQIQPPLQQHSRPAGTVNLGHHPPPALHIAAQTGSSTYPVILNGAGTLSKEASMSTAGNHARMPPSSGVLNQQSKRPKLAAGVGTHPSLASSFPNVSSHLAQPINANGLVGDQMNKNAHVTQHVAQQTPQLPPELESTLMQQVLNLTPEQINSLPVDQRQQVLQLQQMLVKSKR